MYSNTPSFCDTRRNPNYSSVSHEPKSFLYNKFSTNNTSQPEIWYNHVYQYTHIPKWSKQKQVPQNKFFHKRVNRYYHY
jgi:hypothetical protein